MDAMIRNKQELFQKKPVVAIVISDFGRDAALRFCLALAQEERRYIQETYLKKHPFFDEYRRIILALIGDLPFAKSEILKMYQDRYLDNRVLIGFPGGVKLDDVIPQLGALIFQEVTNALRRRMADVVVMLP